MKSGSGSYYSPPSVQNGVLSPSSDYSDEVNAVTWKRFGEHWGTGSVSSDAYLQQWMSRSMTGAASGESLLFQTATVIARCSLRESKTLQASSSLNLLWKLTGLGKYSKIKISKFCGYRHEALGPPLPPFVSNFAEKKLTPIFLGGN